MNFMMNIAFLILLTLPACHSDEMQEKPIATNSDSQHPKKSRRSIVMNQFNEDEKQASDSVKYYGLDSAYNDCLKLLYVIYGNETLPDTAIHKKISIGECSIRLTHFENLPGRTFNMIFLIFVDDSIPTVPVLVTEHGPIPLSFEVEQRTKKIVKVRTSRLGTVPVGPFWRLYNNTLNSKTFRTYVNEHRQSLDPKFEKILEGLVRA